jgi:two-component system, sensor histidine kinase and response regulator
MTSLTSPKSRHEKLELDCTEFNLWECVEATVKALAVPARQKNLNLAFHLERDVPQRGVGDPWRLRQVLANLLSNAIKFTPQGEVTLHVAKLAATSDDVTVQFSVRDTGFGIPSEKQQIIFQAFTQADSSSTRKFGGTGLGLTIASQLVAMMGGRICVVSEVGKGSTFHFTVRLRLAERAETAPDSQSHFQS